MSAAGKYPSGGFSRRNADAREPELQCLCFCLPAPTSPSSSLPSWELPPRQSQKPSPPGSSPSQSSDQSTLRSSGLNPPAHRPSGFLTLALLPRSITSEVLEPGSLGWNPCPNTHGTCKLGKVLSPSVPQFSHLTNGVAIHLPLKVVLNSRVVKCLERSAQCAR